MTSFNFTLPIYAFDQWDGAATDDTVGYPIGTTFTLNTGATLTNLQVEDDDGLPVGDPGNEFSDGFLDTPGDGSAPSTANNDQLLTQDVVVNGQQFFAGDNVELEFAFTTTSGETFWLIRIAGQNVGISGPVLPTPGTTFEVNGGIDGVAVPIDDVPCYTDGSMVETPTGPVAIELLKKGDLVMTLDHGPQPIEWIGHRDVTTLDMIYRADLRPIVIAPGALGPDVPNRALSVSPNHRLMLSEAIVPLYFGAEEVLVAAKFLLNGTTIAPARSRRAVRYWHMLLPKHEVLIVDGAPAESLFRGVDQFNPEDLMDLELAGHDFAADEQTARPVLRQFEAMLLVA